MTLQEILANSKDFADGIELTIGTEKVNLGQLRELSTKQQKDLSDKIAGAETREREARDTAMKAADLLSKLEDARTKLAEQRPPQNQNTEDDFDKSEWWEPVRKRFTERDTKWEAAMKKIDALTANVQNAATIWAKDRWRNQFDRVAPRLKKVKEYESWDFDKVLGYATENKIVDADGMPSVEEAVMRLTKANEIETREKEAYEKGLQAGRNKARMDSMPRPSSASGGRPTKGKSAVEEIGLEGLGDDAANDPELMEMFNKITDLEM